MIKNYNKSELFSKKTILTVDDNLENLKVLIAFLEDSGFELMIAQSGEEALKHTEKITPDIILLDVLMPGIDGFETCRRLKRKSATKEIPVIFMTALSETIDKVKGFKVGAVDYITKPLHHEEVLARINSHLMIKEYEQQLQQQNLQLRKFTEKINADIDRARIVQQKFLPDLDNMPFAKIIDWDYYFKPAEKIGGDYFDLGIIENKSIALLFSDVCGHGMSAAFITAILKTTFQSWVDSSKSLSLLGTTLNSNLFRLTPTDSFATVFIAIYNIATEKFQYVNFGHNPDPWLIPSDKKRRIQALNDAHNLPLGFQEQIDISVAEVNFKQGDGMVYISDGVLENCSPDEEDEKLNSKNYEYDRKLFENLLEKNRSLSVNDLIKKIRKEIDNFTGSSEQFDDRTILAFKIKDIKYD